MNFRTLGKLTFAIVVSQLAGIISAFATAPAISAWYVSVEKPAIAPPNWVFAPVWTTLFTLMGIAAFLVWKRGLERKDVRRALTLFGVQLVLNTWWSLVFFGLRNPGLALAEIIMLWMAILWTIVLFGKISRTAMWLLVPYLAWVSFAGYLNFAIWRLN